MKFVPEYLLWFVHKYLLWMRKAQDHVLQQRRTRYTRYDRESRLKEKNTP